MAIEKGTTKGRRRGGQDKFQMKNNEGKKKVKYGRGQVVWSEVVVNTEDFIPTAHTSAETVNGVVDVGGLR